MAKGSNLDAAQEQTYIAYYYSNSIYAGYTPPNYRSNIGYINLMIKNAQTSLQRDLKNLATQYGTAAFQFRKYNASGQDAAVATVLGALLQKDDTPSLFATDDSLDQLTQQTIAKTFETVSKELGDLSGSLNGLTTKQQNGGDVSSFCRSVEEFVSQCLGLGANGGQLLADFETKLVNELLATTETGEMVANVGKLGLTGGSKLGKRAVATVIQDMLASDTASMRGLYKTSANDIETADRKMTERMRQALALVGALKVYGNEKVTFTKKSGNTGDEILNQLRQKMASSFIGYVATTCRDAASVAALNASTKLAEQVADVNSQIEKSIANGFRQSRYETGSMGIGIDVTSVEFKKDARLQALLRQGAIDPNMFTQGVYSRSNIAYDKFGITVKEVQPTKKGELPRSVLLKSDTSLSTLIYREAGMGSKGIYATLALAMGHGVDEGPTALRGTYSGLSDAQVTEKWNTWKNVLVCRAFVNLLTGNYIKGTATSFVYVLNGKAYQMTELIKKYMNAAFSSTSPQWLASMTDNKGTERTSYVGLNQWVSNYQYNAYGVKSDVPSMAVSAEQRSPKQSAKGLQLLYQTKVRINMNSALFSNALGVA